MKKLAKRKPEPQTEAPQRIPWPDYAPGAESGLTAAQAAELLSGGWGNEAVASPTKSDKQIVRENVFTYFNLIFIILAVCLLVVGDWKDMSFLLIVAANTGIVDGICRPAKKPVFAGEEGICSGCGVATLSISYYDLGYTTGEMAVKILNGESDISTMPIEYTDVTKKYNKAICDDLGLTVPEGYVEIEA